jgi:3D (Asp-Asp-Asp) domain-containing protein
MIAFGPDTDVSATRLQRTARRVLLVGCSVLSLGVISSVVRLSAASPPTEAVLTPRQKFVADPGPFPPMAAARPALAHPVVELVRDVPIARPAVRSPRVVWMLVTAYCPCPKCCGRNAAGVTASGRPITAANGHFVAAPAEFAFGSKLTVPGYNKGRPVPVLDRGGAIKGTRLDVFFPTHDEARQWGRRWVAVTITGG